jgi:hypothetical protein
MRHITSHIGVLVFLLFFGCVSVDSRVWDESVDREATVALAGKFSNRASYRSTGEFIARDNLAELLDVPARGADAVFVSLEKGDLTMTFVKADKSAASRVYRPQDGLLIDSEGRIQLPTKSSGAVGDGVIGYQSMTVTLFINKQGDLVTIQSGAGGGTIGIIIPIGIYAKHMAIFPRQK